MKKSLISLVAAAALVGGTMAVATPSFAGTVNASGGTNVSMYGFIRTYTQWDKKAGVNGLVADATANPKATWSGLDLTQTRLGLKFNSGNGISGKLETDFSPGTLRIRHAYVVQSLGGSAWLLIGQSWGPAFTGATFTNTLNWDVQPGELGPAIRGGQITLGDTFGFSGGSLEAVVALGNLSGFVQGDTTLSTANTLATKATKAFNKATKAFNDASALPAGNAADAAWNASDAAWTKYYTINAAAVAAANAPGGGVVRITTPALIGKLIAKVKTGFGAPVTVWGALFGQSLKIASPIDGSAISKTPYAFASGMAIPLSMVTLKTNFNYARGFTGLISVAMPGPNSYYKGTDGSVKTTTATAWNLEADVAPTKDLGFALGYFTARFKKAAVVAKGKGTVRKTATVFAQVSYKTSKATEVAFEWDHLKTKYYDGTDGIDYYNNKGNQEFVTYQYNF